MKSHFIYKITINTILIGLFLSVAPAQAGLGDWFNPISWFLPSSKNFDYDAMAKAFGNGIGQGAGQAAQQGVDTFFKSLHSNMDPNNNGEGAQALNAFFANIASQFGQQGAGQQSINNFFHALGSQFAQNGEGAEGINNFFRAITNVAKEGGELDKGVREILENLGNIMQGPEFHNAAEQTRAGVQTEIREFTTLFRETSAETRDAVDDETTKWARVGQDQLREGGGIYNLKNEAINLATEAGDSLWWNVQKNLMKTGVALGVGVALCASGYYGNKVFWHYVERKLKRPKLIITSSYKNPFQRMVDFLLRRKEEVVPMVFDPDLQTRLGNIVKSTQNITQKIKQGRKNVKYRNLLLHGPPGTGKTMFANQLARKSGMEFVTMSGSSFAKFKKGEGIIAMDELFAWANKSKGLMIFIDEADAFLGKRENMKHDTEMYQILNNFLNYSGERSDKFMIVFATNHMTNLDSAMWRRIDDLVEVPLPKVAERERVLTLYRDRILHDVKQNGQEFVDAVKQYFTDAKIKEVAVQTEGLSNGDLEGIINTIKTDADITDTGLINTELIDLAVERAINKLNTFTQATNVNN